MNRKTIRLVIVLAALSIVGITVTQIFWIRKAFDFREKEFDQKVMLSLQEVAKSILAYNNRPHSLIEPIKKLSPDYYVVMVNDAIDEKLLEVLLKNEFEKRAIATDFQYTIYDCVSKEMVYGNYITFHPGDAFAEEKKLKVPRWNKDNYYFGVSFLNKDMAIVGQMRFWSFSSVVLLLVIVFFSYTLFVILKQKRLSEIQKDFINNMTHEFKTPISTISISSEVLKNPSIVHTPERLLNYATIIQEEAGRLKSQVERVLQMATVDKEDFRLKKEEVNVHEIISRTAENIALSLQQKNGNISFQLLATKATVQADPLHLTNMLYNLLDNAVKYTKENPRITIVTGNQKEGICISIQDNGIGISGEEQKKVFDKFYRVPTGNIHDVKGFGLGLNYVKIMAKAHKGGVKLDSRLGLGSIFTIFLPFN